MQNLNKAVNSKNKVYLFVSIITVLVLVSCVQSAMQQRGPKYGGTLYINSSDIADVVFPGQVLKNSEQLIVNQIYDGLVKYHTRTLEIIPALAKNWFLSQNGTQYTFYLNANARFHADKCFGEAKGRRIVASDVKYSIEQICKIHKQKNYQINKPVKNIEGFNQFESGLTDNIQGIEAFNDTTLIITLLQPDEMFIHYLAGTNSLVFAKEAFLAYGINNTVGSGAYKLTMPKIKGQPVILTANNNYYVKNKQFEQLPFIDTIVVSFITSASRELDMFANEKLDVVFGVTSQRLAPFLDNNIARFQSNPPYFIMKQTVDANGNTVYNLLRSNVKGLDFNPLSYFCLSGVYFEELKPQAVVIE